MKNALRGLSVILVIAGLYGGYLHVSAVNVSREWARVAELPVPTWWVGVDTRGSAFTREFVLDFNASSEELDAWLAASPGIQDADITESGSQITYSIAPGGGAQFAEVVVDRETGAVRIRTYWS